MNTPDDGAVVQPEVVYEAPMVTRMGTLAELTQGGTVGGDDGMGGAGGEGSA